MTRAFLLVVIWGVGVVDSPGFCAGTRIGSIVITSGTATTTPLVSSTTNKREQEGRRANKKGSRWSVKLL